ncbi:putative multi-drug efflux transporter [Streptomyces spiroverticillatus]|uniref:Multi-drug efflux transporter n=1 Tax=Streptomyces finlayi TaxID=67296 RepID=A0A919C7N5_9ACTN|nr:MFS transporter [Streptomyces finlayi]GGZ97059.1 putative multi-drug efflux transporter [Streptomyces spiroverticillatus]GHC82286.1 putative multi-drug efflux transporter [Streptomyces finlayi]
MNAIPPTSGAQKNRRAPHRIGFWFVAVAFSVLMAFGTAPTPLWPLYQDRDGFGATTVTIAFAIMVVGASVGFLGLGHLSDRYGRRRVIVPALVVDVVAAAMLALWPDLPVLLAARLLTGLAVGLMASTATAYLMDLWHEAHPGQPLSPTPGLVAAVSNLGGLAMGPLVVGALAQWAGAPLVTPYVLFAVAMLVLLVLILATPETVDTELAKGVRPARFALREGARPVFVAAAAGGFFAFAASGIFSALGAIIVRLDLGITSPLVAGTAAFAVFGASALAQLLLGRMPVVRMLTLGAVLFPVGLGLTALTLYVPSLPLFLVAAVLSGSGSGLLFKASVGQTAAAADPSSRAGVLAVFFVIAYVGMGVPSVLFSIAANQFGRQPVMIVFAVLLSVGSAVAARIGVRAARPAPVAVTPPVREPVRA